jgi:hypothetical protein
MTLTIMPLLSGATFSNPVTTIYIQRLIAGTFFQSDYNAIAKLVFLK